MDVSREPAPGGAGGADATGATAGAPPPFSLAQIIQQLRTQWGGAYEGTTESWSGTGAINYYIGGPPYSTAEEGAYKVSMTALMLSRATLAFELWDDLIARDLNQVSTAAFGQIQFEYASQTYNANNVLATDGGTYSRAWFSPSGNNGYGTANYATIRDEIWLNSNWNSHNADNDIFFGGYGFQTYMHEIGHALGLSHPGTYNAGNNPITYANNAEYSLDNRQYTIMSYFGGYLPNAGWQQDGTFSNYLYSSTPMLHDVAAIQAIYGADTTTRAGDTTYGFHSNAGREVFNFNTYSSPIVTVWDGGGNDTVDLSGFAAGQQLDLNAGMYSNVGGMLGNFAIAYNVTIENAIGGTAGDALYGNDANNTLRGGLGNDTIDGRTGFDTAVFSGPRAAYTLTDLGGGNFRVAGPDDTDTVSNIEQLQFDDQTVGVTVTPPPLATATRASSDFDGDHRSDIFWRTNGGALAIWEMNGTQIKAADYIRMGSDAIGTPGPDWHIVETGSLPSDFDGDGRGDVLWWTDSGVLAIWEMNGTQIKAADYIRMGSAPLKAPGSDWHAENTGDFDGDGKADILWRTDSGILAVWEMNDTQVEAADYLRSGSNIVPTPGTDWHIVGTDDFDGDGKADLLWRTDSGILAVWEMNGTQIKSADYIRSGAEIVKTPGSDWHIAGTGDFDGDGRGDLLWRTDSGLLAIWEMNGTEIKTADYLKMGSAPLKAPGTDWHIDATGDYDGDDRDDILWRTDSGALAVWKMDGFQISAADFLKLGSSIVGAPGSDWNIVHHQYDLL